VRDLLPILALHGLEGFMASALLYDRLQFAFTSTFHYFFPQLTMGLALLLLYLRVVAGAIASALMIFPTRPRKRQAGLRTPVRQGRSV